MVEFGILGSLRLGVDGGDLAVGGARRRGLVARLLVDANQVVAFERLVDDVWDGSSAAAATARTYVWRLRTLLGPERILTRSPGYVLVVRTGELDAAHFLALVEQARDRTLPPQDAVDLLDQADRLWRGPALAEFADLPWARPAAQRLTRWRLDATADRLDALLRCGRAREVAGEAESLVAWHPLDERLWGLLVVAHYRCGRQADALRSCEQARRLLREELGIAPCPALQALEQAVLRQDLAPGLVVAEPEPERERGAGHPGGRPAPVVGRPVVSLGG